VDKEQAEEEIGRLLTTPEGKKITRNEMQEMLKRATGPSAELGIDISMGEIDYNLLLGLLKKWIASKKAN